MAGTCVSKTSCPDCGSSDGLQVFEENGKRTGYCFSCSTYYGKVEGLTPSVVEKKERREGPRLSMSIVKELSAAPLPDRGIRKEVLEDFGVKVGYSPTDRNTIAYHFYPSITKEGTLQGYKVRGVADKSFGRVGTTKGAALFGQSTCSLNKKVFVTEGELDALALYQVLLDKTPPQFKVKGRKPSVVSLSNGASSAAKQLTEQWKWLSNFREVVLVFDSDTPGRKAAETVAKAMGDNNTKILIADLSEKDACDMLLKGKEDELYSSVLFNAMPYEPDGIINAKDAWDRYKERKSVKCYPYPEQFKALNEKTYGWRLGSLITVTSGSGMGKTSFLREVEKDILDNTDFKIADIHLEEDIGDTIEGLMALELNKRIQLPDVKVPEEEEKAAYDKLFGSGRIEMYDHFGGMNDGSLLGRIRYMATYLHCKVFFLDHLSIVISETADEGDERRRIDTLMTRLAKLVKELNIVLFLVVHLRKASGGKSFEEGAVPSSDDLRGSAALKQLSWDVIGLSRNQQDSDERRRNTSGIHVLKCRFSGSTGPAGYALFDTLTGRLVEAEEPTVDGSEEEDNGLY